MELSPNNLLLLLLTFLLFCNGFSPSSASTPPAKIVNGFISNAAASLMKLASSLNTNTKTGEAISGRAMMKFEGGYTVETVFDGSKLGIEPYAVELLPNSGELLVLDSANSNLYRISSSLSQYTRPKLIAGSAEGYSGHVDGKLREARMNHPKGVAVDERGNIYVADTMNMAIRKISDAGVTTIAGGKRSRGGGHVDGPGQEAEFSNDFDVVYVGSSCSLLVIDRGNRAIREIQLRFEDCAYQYEGGFPLGVAVLLAAGFFGYMLALLQRRVGSVLSSQNEFQTGGESTNQEETTFTSLTKHFINAAEFLKKKPNTLHHHHNHPHHTPQPIIRPSSQESFEVPEEDLPPPVESRAPTPRKTYAFMSKDADRMQHQLRQSHVFLQQQLQRHASPPQTFYQQSCENTREIVFGAVQEERRREPAVEPTKQADSSFDRRSFRFRSSYDGDR